MFWDRESSKGRVKLKGESLIQDNINMASHIPIAFNATHYFYLIFVHAIHKNNDEVLYKMIPSSLIQLPEW